LKRITLILALLFTALPAAAEEYNPRTKNELAFAEILKEHQGYNRRLQKVAAPLLKTNVALCPRTTRDIGISVHTLSDYQSNLQPFAEVLMGASDRLSIRTLRQGSPADKAGLKTGDVIIGINGSYMPRGFTVRRFFEVATQTAYDGETAELTIRRGEDRHDMNLSPETLCDYPINVFFHKEANGHTDGEQVIITSELMKIVPDDVNLALIIAHEMAHAIEGHQRKSKDLELKADRMALVMMTRAGYDIARAISYWRDAVHPHAEFQETSSTHPSIKERYENFRREQKRIKNSQARGTALAFD